MDFLVLDQLQHNLEEQEDLGGPAANRHQRCRTEIVRSGLEGTESLSPRSAQKLHLGAQKVSALFTALSSADVVGAVQVLASSDGKELRRYQRRKQRSRTVAVEENGASGPAKSSWWSWRPSTASTSSIRGHVRKSTSTVNAVLSLMGMSGEEEATRSESRSSKSNEVDDQQHSLEEDLPGQTRIRRGTFINTMDEEEVDELRKCWNLDVLEEPRNNTCESVAEQNQTDGASQQQAHFTPPSIGFKGNPEAEVTAFMDRVDQFLQLLHQKKEADAKKEQTLVPYVGGRTRFGSTILDLSGIVRNYLPSSLNAAPSKQDLIVDKLGGLKEDLLDLLQEWNRAALAEPVDLSGLELGKRSAIPTAPPPPPPPPPPAPSMMPLQTNPEPTAAPTLQRYRSIKLRQLDSTETPCSQQVDEQEDSTASPKFRSRCATSSTTIQEAIRLQFNREGGLHLRKTVEERSPGGISLCHVSDVSPFPSLLGTPLRSQSPMRRGEMQEELFDKLRRRFRSMHQKDPADEDSNEEEDEETGDFLDSEVTPSKHSKSNRAKATKWMGTFTLKKTRTRSVDSA